MQMVSDQQLIRVTLLDKLRAISLATIKWAVEPRPHRADIGAASRPFVLPRPDEELDPRFLNVDPHFDFWIQIEDRENVIVDRVMLAGNAIHGLETSMASFVRLRRDWQSDTFLSRSE